MGKISGSWYSFAQDGAMLADKWSGKLLSKKPMEPWLIMNGYLIKTITAGSF